jgi:transposase
MDQPQATPVHVGVGIDTARYGHHVSFLGENRQDVTDGFIFLESHQGYAELESALRKIAQREQNAVHFDVRIDAAGQYATNLEAFLRQLDVAMTISVGEPKRNRDYKNVHYPKRKADTVDSRACARFAIVERPAASPEVPAAMRRLAEVASRLSSQRKQTTRSINQLHNLLARAFPELDTIVCDVSAQWVLEMLAKYPSAKRIAAARTLSSVRYMGGERAERIQSAARTTTASFDGAVAEALVEHAVENLRYSQQVEHKLEQLLEQAYEELGEGGHRQLITIAGIGKRTAAALAAKIVSIDRFSTPEQLVNYFGAFPEENTSGVDKYGNPVPVGTRQMSSKGNDLARGYLWMACQAAIRCNPALRALYRRQRQAGKRGDVALGHCMRKLLHLVFAIWKTNRPFDPAHYPWEVTTPQTDDNDAGALTNELATRFEAPAADTPAPPVHAQSSAMAIAQPASTSQAAQPIKNAAGRKEAMPQRKAVTAATNELATRKLALASVPSKPAQPAVVHGAPRRSAGRVWVDFAYVRSQITIEQVLSKLGVIDQLRGRGPQRRGPCPIHGSEGRAGRPFSVHFGKNVFRCLNPTCAKQGNVLDLWAAVHQRSLHEAAIDLVQVFHLHPTPPIGHSKGTR